jgi:hypothetical protein
LTHKLTRAKLGAMPKKPEHPQPGLQTEAEASVQEGDHTPPEAPLTGLEAAMTGLEVIAVTAGIKAGFDLLGKGTQSGIAGIAEYMKKEWPLANIVLASWLDEDLYHVAIKAVNLTPHAIYIEKLWVEKPAKDIGFDVRHLESGEELGEISRSDSYFPIRVPPQDVAAFVLRLTDDSCGSLKKAKIAELSYNYTLAGGAGAGTAPERNVKKVTVSLRAKGPAFREKRRAGWSTS